jgi:hypothetical protein
MTLAAAGDWCLRFLICTAAAAALSVRIVDRESSPVNYLAAELRVFCKVSPYLRSKLRLAST